MTPHLQQHTNGALYKIETKGKENSAAMSANRCSVLPMLPMGHGRRKSNNQKDQHGEMVI